MLKRYDLFYDESNKPTMVERPGGSGQFVFAKDADAEIARLNDELTCGSEAYHSIKALFEECQTARDEAGFLGPVPECIRDLSERGNKLRETLNFVREAILDFLPADAGDDDLKAKIIARIDADTEYRL